MAGSRLMHETLHELYFRDLISSFFLSQFRSLYRDEQWPLRDIQFIF